MVYREEVTAKGLFEYKQGRLKVEDKVREVITRVHIKCERQVGRGICSRRLEMLPSVSCGLSTEKLGTLCPDFFLMFSFS